MTRTLIRGGCVLTLAKTNFAEADVLVTDGVISEVAPRIRVRDAEVIDAADSIVMPGFVDAHRHACEALWRNLGDADPSVPVRAGPHYGSGDVYAATLVGLLGALDAGITAVVDWCEVASDTALVDAALQAHADAGTRSVFAPGPAPWAVGGWPEALRRAEQAPRGDLVSIAAGVSEPGGDDDAAWAAARELGLRLHTHAGARPEGRGSVAAAEARGVLGDDVTLVHGTHLDDGDLDAAASSGASVVLTPCSEMGCGTGTPPLQAMIDRDLRPGLGVDSERVAPGDAFGPMRTAISLQHAMYFDLKLAGKAGLPRLLSTRDVIRYATTYASRAAGLIGTGTLEPGERADVIVLRADRPNIHPLNDPIGAVVWGMDTSNVEWVIVGGRVVKRAGSLEADVPAARRAAIAARDRVAAAAGMLAGVGGMA